MGPFEELNVIAFAVNDVENDDVGNIVPFVAVAS